MLDMIINVINVLAYFIGFVVLGITVNVLLEEFVNFVKQKKILKFQKKVDL